MGFLTRGAVGVPHQRRTRWVRAHRIGTQLGELSIAYVVADSHTDLVFVLRRSRSVLVGATIADNELAVIVQ